MRGAGRFGVGGSSGGGVHRYSHRAVQLEEEQNKSEHRAARCVCGRHSYLHEVLLGRKRGSSVLTTGSESVLRRDDLAKCERDVQKPSDPLFIHVLRADFPPW